MTRLLVGCRAAVFGLGVFAAAPADAQVTRSYAVAELLRTIPRCPGPELQIDFRGVEDVLVQSVTLTVTVNVADASFLRLSMYSYATGTQVSLGVPRPAPVPTPLSGTYTFTDSAPQDFYQTVLNGGGAAPPGVYRLSDDAGIPRSIDGTFAGQRSEDPSSSLWNIRLSEDCGASGAAATISAATLTIVGYPVRATVVNFNPRAPIPEGPGGPQQPGAPLDVNFTVPAGRGLVQSVAAELRLEHSWAGEAVAQLIAPDGTSHVLFGYTGAPDDSAGSSTRLVSGVGYTFSDRAASSWWEAAAATAAGLWVPAGSYRTSQLGGPGSIGAPTLMDPVFAGKAAEGVWTLRLTDGGNQGLGFLRKASLTLLTSIPPGPPTVGADSFTTPFQTALVVNNPGVLVNDVSDASGTLAAALESAPLFGAVTFNPSGGFVYTQNAGYSGVDTFSYRATNLVGTSAAATVTIEVAPSVALPPNSLVVRSYEFDPSRLGPIPRSTFEYGGEGSGLACGGGGLTVPIAVPDDLLLQSMSLTLTASVTRVGLLGVALRAPSGRWFSAKWVNLAAPGTDGTFVGTYTFSDVTGADLLTTAAANPAALPPGTYRFPPQNSGIDEPTVGVWMLSAAEYCHTGEQGRIDAASIALTGLRTVPVAAHASSLGNIPDSTGGPQLPGPVRDVTFFIPPGRGEVRSVWVAATVYHPRRGDVVARLIAPDGTSHVLFGYTGATTGGLGSLDSISGQFIFSDRAATLWPPPLNGGGLFRTAQLGGAGAPTAMDVVFANRPSEGVWTLRLTDGAAGETGHVSGATLSLVTSVVPDPPVAAPDAFSAFINTALIVPAPGVLANDSNPSAAALSAVLVSPPASGTLALSSSGGFTYTPNPGFLGDDQFVYQPDNGPWQGAATTVKISVAIPTTIQPPTGLRVSSIDGNRLMLQWSGPAEGPAADGYVVEAGLTPGQTLVALPMGPTPTLLSVTAPNGVFLARVHALADGAKSAASNEVRVVVNVPVPPSAPAALTGLVHGNTVSLAWRRTFEGGAPTALVLDATGTAAATMPLPASDALTVANVPAGTYSVAVRALNAGGVSPPSNSVTLTVPAVCSGLPDTPIDFVAYSVGNVVSLSWDTPATGAAATSYLVTVAGPLAGSVPVSGRAISGRVPSGAYSFSLTAVNACGVSPATLTQTVVQ